MKAIYQPVVSGSFAGLYAVHIEFNRTPKDLNGEILKILQKNPKYKVIFLTEPFLDSESMLDLALKFQHYHYIIVVKTDGIKTYQWINKKVIVIIDTENPKIVLKYGNELWFKVTDKKLREPLVPKETVLFCYSDNIKLLKNFIKKSKQNWRILSNVNPKPFMEVL